MLRPEQKVVVQEDFPERHAFDVSPDGKRLFFSAGGKFVVTDADGNIVDKFGVPNASSPGHLMPLPDGWFIAQLSYQQGQIAAFSGTSASSARSPRADARANATIFGR